MISLRVLWSKKRSCAWTLREPRGSWRVTLNWPRNPSWILRMTSSSLMKNWKSKIAFLDTFVFSYEFNHFSSKIDGFWSLLISGKTLKSASCLARLKMNSHLVLSSKRRSRSFRWVAILNSSRTNTFCPRLKQECIQKTHQQPSLNRPALRSWKKRSKLSVQPAPRLRSREPISPGNLRRSVRG